MLTIGEAGAPVRRVHELLQADEEEFAAAIADIDKRLRAEIRERQRHREQIARLACGDNLVLPRRWSTSSTSFGRSASTTGSSGSNATAGSRWPHPHPSGSRSGWRASGSRSPPRNSSTSISPMDTLAFDTAPPARRLIELLKE
ncbi:hypothetical protein [Streptomyces phaeochromogenes]|uniref:hypothetical protein n=1 Tax=Streptomyces phaeochromogenes TaxID=1923 RepID=UPI0033EB60BE